MENWYNKCIVKYGVPVGETKLNFILITLESKRCSRQIVSRKNLWFSYRDLHERLIFGSPWSGLSWSLHTLEHVPLRHCAFLMVTNRYIKQFLRMLVFMNNSILWSLFNKWKMEKYFISERKIIHNTRLAMQSLVSLGITFRLRMFAIFILPAFCQ